jgi:transcriptional regulator with XRE-family HTH domain
MTTNTHTSTDINVLMARDCISELKERYPNYSSSQIAKEVGISQPTFNRIENGQGIPTFVTISKLLSATGKSHKINDVINLAYPQLPEDIRFDFSHNEETPIMGGDFAKYFSVKDYRNIILLAATRSGTTRHEVKDEYGVFGIKRLEELLAAQILNEVRGIIKADDEKISFDQEILKQSTLDCINDNYDAQRFGNNENWLSFQTESVNREKAMALIITKLRKTYKEIKEEILYSPEYFGNDKVFIAMVADSLLKESLNSTQEISQ